MGSASAGFQRPICWGVEFPRLGTFAGPDFWTLFVEGLLLGRLSCEAPSPEPGRKGQWAQQKSRPPDFSTFKLGEGKQAVP